MTYVPFSIMIAQAKKLNYNVFLTDRNLHVHTDKQISDSNSEFSSRQYHLSRSRDVRFEVFKPETR